MKNERNLHGSNSIGYWAEDGYLHRYYLLRDPYITKSTTLLATLRSQVRDAIMAEVKNIRVQEDERLTMFGKAIDYGGNVNEIFALLRSFISDAGAGLKNIFEVTLNSNRKIKCTDNHRLLTSSGWKEVKDLLPTDVIAVRVGNNNTQEYNIDKLKMIGYLIGDGCFRENNFIHFYY